MIIKWITCLLLLLSSNTISAQESSHRRAMDYQAFHAKDKYGFVHKTNGDTIVPAIYDQINARHDLGVLVVTFQKKQGCLDYTGATILEPIYDRVQPALGVLVCTMAGEDELRSFSGDLLTEKKYTGLMVNSPNVLYKKEAEKKVFGIVNEQGEVEFIEIYDILTDIYCTGKDILKGLVKGKGWQLFDNKLNNISELYFEEIKGCDSGKAILYRLNGLWGILDDQGKTISEPVFSTLEPMHSIEDAYIAVREGKYGIITSALEIIFPFDYEVIHEQGYYYSDYGTFKKDGLYGVLNWKGDTLLPFEYTKINYGYEGNFLVRDISGKEGVFSYHGEVLLPVEMEEMVDLATPYGYLMIVRKGGKYGLFHDNKLSAPIDYDNIQRERLEDDETLFLVRQGNKQGWMRSDGTLLNNTMYNEVTLFVNGYSQVRLGKKVMQIDKYGDPKE
jgi:hypothetical protein